MGWGGGDHEYDMLLNISVSVWNIVVHMYAVSCLLGWGELEFELRMVSHVKL